MLPAPAQSWVIRDALQTDTLYFKAPASCGDIRAFPAASEPVSFVGVSAPGDFAWGSRDRHRTNGVLFRIWMANPF